ncbi:hypothetical protein [Mucisphaera sp.]|uniref:hypothetical protein n=1 Tax=Mucisphaera sp. TaxID=2913024 RepID=UPI003D0FB6B6
MRNTRTIQLISLITAAALLAGATMITPSINRQRLDLHLTYDIETGDDIPATYTLLAAGLGSFRGILANWAWYRIEMMKRDGELYEANQLARVITTLQPRFPQVWSFQAWNMAYNISVITKTPEERWDWVSKGIRLLREKGIPNNPTAIRLYRELAWILFHKMGQFSDDMNWYYKLQWAREWQEVLGAPTEGATAEEAANRIRPIAQAADRYLVFNRPPHEARMILEGFANDHPELKDTIDDLLDIGAVRLRDRLQRVRTDILSIAREQDDQFDRVLELAEEQIVRSTRDPLEMLAEDSPEVIPLLDILAQNNIEPDTNFLRAVGVNLIFTQYYSAQALVDLANQGQLSPERQVALGFMLDNNFVPGLRALVPYLRAQALVNEYRMDPQFMLFLLEKYGPLDWRHPAAHAIYWAALGIERTRVVFDQDRYDILNTDRQVIHGLQVLMFSGRVTYDPFAGTVDQLPDPRFIEPYELAVYEGSERSGEVDLDREGVISQFASGYENFLHKAIVYSYLYGDVDQAQNYYQKARSEFSDNHMDGRYTLALEEFVMLQLWLDKDQRQTVVPFIDAQIARGLNQGLARSRPDIFARSVEIAQTMHGWYQQERDYQIPNAPRQRLQLEPFNVMLTKSYEAFMRNASVPIIYRARAYANTPVQLREATYAGFQSVLQEHAAQQGIDFARAFPAPPGFVPPETADLDQNQPNRPSTIQRQ